MLKRINLHCDKRHYVFLWWIYYKIINLYLYITWNLIFMVYFNLYPHFRPTRRTNVLPVGHVFKGLFLQKFMVPKICNNNLWKKNKWAPRRYLYNSCWPQDRWDIGPQTWPKQHLQLISLFWWFPFDVEYHVILNVELKSSKYEWNNGTLAPWNSQN